MILWPAGCRRGDGDPEDEVRDLEAVPGFFLQAGEQGVAAGIAEVEGDPVHAGLQVVPLGPGLHLDTGEACAAQCLWPAGTHSARQPGVVWDLRLPGGQDQPPARPEDPAGLAGGCSRIGCEMEGVDGHGGVGAGLPKPGMGEIADDESCPAGQAEQRRPVRGLIYPDG